MASRNPLQPLLDQIPKPLRNKYFLVLAVFFFWMIFMDRHDFLTQWRLQRAVDQMQEEKELYIEKIDLTVKLIETEKARVAKEEADRKAEVEKIAKAAEEKPKVEEPKGPVEYITTGTVGSTGKTARTPASHRLFDADGNILYDLRWDKGDLSKLMGSKVGIVGKVKEYDGWAHKVIVIERIDVIEDDEPSK